MKNKNFYLRMPEMVWPNSKSGDYDNLLMKLNNGIYSGKNEEFNKQDCQKLMSILEAYDSILFHPGRNLEETRKLVRDLRNALENSNEL